MIISEERSFLELVDDPPGGSRLDSSSVSDDSKSASVTGSDLVGPLAVIDFGSVELDCDDSGQGRKNINTTAITTATPISSTDPDHGRSFVDFDCLAFQKIGELNLLCILFG